MLDPIIYLYRCSICRNTHLAIADRIGAHPVIVLSHTLMIQTVRGLIKAVHLTLREMSNG